MSNIERIFRVIRRRSLRTPLSRAAPSLSQARPTRQFGSARQRMSLVATASRRTVFTSASKGTRAAPRSPRSTRPTGARSRRPSAGRCLIACASANRVRAAADHGTEFGCALHCKVSHRRGGRPADGLDDRWHHHGPQRDLVDGPAQHTELRDYFFGLSIQ